MEPDDRSVLLMVGSAADNRHDDLDVDVVIDCGGYWLVRETDSGEWFMGRSEAESTIVCWASYGTDLETEILAL